MKRANWLIDSLINLGNISKSDKDEKIDISKIIDEIIKQNSSKIKKKWISINIDLIENAEVFANKSYMYILFWNIICNAIKYNKYKWNIDIIINKDFFEIKDTWVWIPKNCISKVFDPFYRVQQHRDKEWFWLGLALVKKISDNYWWTIQLTSEEWKGTDFKLLFHR